MPKTDITVRELIDKVQHGDLTLPEMQRRYVWTSTRVRDLLDSLYRGYPSGTILVWETEEDIDTRKLSVDTGDARPTTTQKLLLLDGQQRLTSLTAVIKGQPLMVRNRKRPVDILFNLEHPEGPPTEIYEVDEADSESDLAELEEQTSSQRDIQRELRLRTFVVAATALRNDPRWVSVSDIFTKSDRELLRPLGINSDDDRWDKYADRLKKVRTIEDYQYVMQVLQKDMSYEEVTEIFVRVNSLGAKLRSSDLALAQITSKWRGFMELLEDFSAEFGDDADYVTEWVAVRMLTVCATKQALYKNINRVNRAGLEKAWEEAKRGVHFAINFVRHNAGFESLSHLSASMLLVPIAVYALQHDEKLTPTEEKKLLTWFFYAHMRGHYGMGSSESILNSDLSVLYKGGSLDDLIENLFEHVRRFEVRPQDLAGKNMASPFFTTIYTMFRSQGAKDWFTGLKLSSKMTGATHTIQAHHIFPKSLLQDAGYESREINEIANMAFIGGKTNREITNKLPSNYLQQYVIDKNGEAPLVSQYVPLERSLWEMDDYLEFLKARRRLLADAINSFMQTIAQPAEGVEDLPAIIAAGESGTLEFKATMRINKHTGAVDKLLEKVILKSIAAFSNSQGGRLLIGVSDDGQALGLADDYKSVKGDKDEFELHLRSLVSHEFGAAFNAAQISVSFPKVKGVEVCQVDIAKGSRPVYVKQDNVDKLYVRSGNSSVDMPISQAGDYLAGRF